MTITEAVYQILDEFYVYGCDVDYYGHKEITWIIENKTEYDFEYYWVNVVAYDKNGIIIDKRKLMIECFPVGEKRKIEHTLPDDTSNIGITIDCYSVENLSECNKEVHLNDLYRADVLTSKEYYDIHEYLFAEADGCIDQEFLCLSSYERKIAAINYLYARGIFSDKEVKKMINCLDKKKRIKKDEKSEKIDLDEETDVIDVDGDNSNIYELNDFIADDIEIITIDELSVRIKNCLRRSNIITIRDLKNKSALELRNVRNMGRKSCDELMAYIEKNGILLKNPEETDIENCLFTDGIANCFKTIKKNTVGDLINMSEDDAKRFVRVCRKRRINYQCYFSEMEFIGMKANILEILKYPSRYMLERG